MKSMYMFLFAVVFAISAHAQQGRMFKVPKPENSTYHYRVGIGVGTNRSSAKTEAKVNVIYDAAFALGMPVNLEDLRSTLQKGLPLSIKLPFSIVCEYYDENAKQMYLLCQVANAGNIIPRYTAYNDCMRKIKPNKPKIRLRNQNEAQFIQLAAIFQQAVSQNFEENNFSSRGLEVKYTYIYGGFGGGLGLYALSDANYNNMSFGFYPYLNIGTPLAGVDIGVGMGFNTDFGTHFVLPSLSLRYHRFSFGYKFCLNNKPNGFRYDYYYYEERKLALEQGILPMNVADIRQTGTGLGDWEAVYKVDHFHQISIGIMLVWW